MATIRKSRGRRVDRRCVHGYPIVSERLEHSTVGITLDTYSHVIPGMREEATKRIDTALRAALKRAK